MRLEALSCDTLDANMVRRILFASSLLAALPAFAADPNPTRTSLLLRWLDAQNTGNFADYQSFYAPLHRAVRRSGPRHRPVHLGGVDGGLGADVSGADDRRGGEGADHCGRGVGRVIRSAVGFGRVLGRRGEGAGVAAWAGRLSDRARSCSAPRPGNRGRSTSRRFGGSRSSSTVRWLSVRARRWVGVGAAGAREEGRRSIPDPNAPPGRRRQAATRRGPPVRDADSPPEFRRRTVPGKAGRVPAAGPCDHRHRR